jgi:hypothetical protein
LERIKLQFAATIECSLGWDNRANGCVQYRFLFDAPMGREELKAAMHDVCLNSGLCEQHFKLDFPNDGITDWNRQRIMNFTQNDKWDKVYLFEIGLRLQKFYYSKGWFLDENGEPTTKTKTRQEVIIDHKGLRATMLNLPFERKELLKRFHIR